MCVRVCVCVGSVLSCFCHFCFCKYLCVFVFYLRFFLLLPLLFLFVGVIVCLSSLCLSVCLSGYFSLHLYQSLHFLLLLSICSSVLTFSYYHAFLSFSISSFSLSPSIQLRSRCYSCCVSIFIFFRPFSLLHAHLIGVFFLSLTVLFSLSSFVFVHLTSLFLLSLLALCLFFFVLPNFSLLMSGCLAPPFPLYFSYYGRESLVLCLPPA